MWEESRHEPVDAEIYPWVVSLAGLSGTEAVLDVGCGNGAYEGALTASGHSGPITAFDIEWGMVQQAAEVGGAELIQADAQRLPFADDSFDAVFAPHMLYHLEDIWAGVAECRRVLRPGGVFVPSTNGDRNVAEVQALIRQERGDPDPQPRPGGGGGGFSLENGEDRLTPHFRSVTRHRFPVERLVVEDPELVAGFVDSMADFQPPSDRPWAELVDGVRRRAAAAIERDGGLTVTWSVGAFVCR